MNGPLNVREYEEATVGRQNGIANGIARKEDTMTDKHWRSRIATLAALIALMLGVTACGGDEDEAEPGGNGEAGAVEVLRMGIEPWIGYGPWWVADEKGFDKEHGVDIKITNFTTDQDINSAFAAGRLDASNIATHTGLRFIGAGLPLKIVLFEDVSREADAVLAGPNVDSVDELQGKKVAYEEGTTSDLLLRYALNQSGMSIEDVEVVPIPAADAGAAAIAGRVDVAVTYEPYLTAALGQDEDFKLLYTAGERPGLISDILVVNEEFASEKADVIVSALKAWNDAIEFYRSNPEEAQAIIANTVGAKPEELKESFAGVDLFDLEQAQEMFEGDFVPLANEIEEILNQQESLEGDPDVEAVLDTSFLERALEE